MEEVEEGSEPTEFTKALGPQDKKAYDCMLQGASSLSHTNYQQVRERSLMTCELTCCDVYRNQIQGSTTTPPGFSD